MEGNNRQNVIKTICLDNTYEATILGISKVGDVNHRTGKKCKLMMADVVKGKMGDAVVLDSLLADKVVFEIPEGEEITDIINEKIARYANVLTKSYGAREDQLGDCYIGEINNDISDNQWHISKTIDKYCHDQLLPKVNAEQKRAYTEKQEKSRMLHEKTVKMEKQKMESYSSQREYEMQNEKNCRLNSPFLKKIGDSITAEGKSLQNYNGVNIQSGDIIRFRSINELGYDTNGTYLYTGYIANSSREDDRISLNGEAPGENYTPVCFTSSKRMDDIFARNDPNEISALLSTFSNEKIYDNNIYMKYIGSIDGMETPYTNMLVDAINGALGNYRNKVNNKINNRQNGNSQRYTQDGYDGR